MINQRRLRLTNRLQRLFRQRSSRKRLVRYGLIVANVLVLGTVAGFVVTSSRGNDHLNASVGVLADQETVTNPVDGQTAYDIAANVAHQTGLEEAPSIDNQAQSARVALVISTSEAAIIPKPQPVLTSLKTRDDIVMYAVQPGDTVTSIAQKFGITSNSVKWSNDLVTDSVRVGTELVIPPLNGFVYTVKTGDTVQMLANRYKVSPERIITFNDAELSGIRLGDQILIPDGQMSYGFTAQYAGNGYAPGFCTWYVASRVAMPSNWGNANTWDTFALYSGWTVSATPRVGAIAQTDSMSYFGHVGYVEAVSEDGSMIKYSDMNGRAGFGRVFRSDWVPANQFPNYIYH